MHTVASIAKALGGRVEGNDALAVLAPAEPSEAGADDLALAMSPKFAEGLREGAARAAILWDGADWRALGLEAAIFVPRPRYALARLTAHLDPGAGIAPGVHPSAVIDPAAEIGAGASIGPLAVIGPEARIGPNARIGAHASVMGALGAGALIREGVRIARGVRVGDGFIAQPGAVIGGDGFSYVTPERSGVEAARASLGGEGGGQGDAAWTRIHSIGGVLIGDDVEIGANATLDAGTIRPTRVGSRTKIDSLVQIGHNVVVGEDCLLCGLVGIAGSARIGDRVVLGGKVGVSDNITVGDDVVAGGGTNIYTNAPAGRVLLGSPATKMETQIEIQKAWRRLPRLFRDVQALKSRLQSPPEGE
ncbi:UDP-3-O-[3-hydroxymyristoyl] glucosamine N-acyltransferase [Hasllibacter halocynthiae]|uniref:UDP-3-O-[3-hydroxymyristoyl] glucosamine N-acyltransferase n=1 Tax=Hasllibacter halocynthiae TaxID=595589 RepID=A0A2T0X8G1_9RHOB|nr:UDP-3-O-(3-hydroxymyristoyl)glucosamine N-acyltransferase [Hasllibacter halocynthiae]PRY95238.1 UDP-3-O-[3-hydroxymyristoyl] glucosamine N-acyltransferase [Hasllibacter halocynthiae]